MSTIVLVTFRALPGRGPQLVAWLRAFHPRLRAFVGFERITVQHDEDAPDVVIEWEQWRQADDHRAMVAAIDAAGGWDTLGAMLESAPETRYLRADAGLTASPGLAAFDLPFSGGCACGAVRYTCTARPVTAVNCFCRDCQRASGGASTTGIAVPAASLEISGQEARRHVTRSAGGNTVWRAFCGACGSPLFAGNSKNTSVVAIKVGSLDDPRPAEPVLQMWTGSAPPWAHVLPELPGFAENPGASGR
jgi:quinol monooxygenase YgiN